jgi:hypothetical protein
MVRVVSCLVFALLGAVAAHTQSSAVPYGHSGAVYRVDILGAGLFSVQRTKSITDPGVAAGRRYEANMRLIRSTTSVTARIGVSFGMNYRLVGPRAGDSVAVRVVWRFPPQGLVNPARGEPQYQSEHTITQLVGGVSANTYTFDEPWEMVPGVWVLELWHGDRKLAEMAYTVTLP